MLQAVAFQASASLFTAFMQGPDALGALADPVVTDPTALQDLHTAVSAFEANIVLEHPRVDEMDALRRAITPLRVRLSLSEDDINPAVVRDILSDLQNGVLRIPREKRDRAWDRVQRLTTHSVIDFRSLFKMEGEIEVVSREMRKRYPGQHVFVTCEGVIIAHDSDPDIMWNLVRDDERRHGPAEGRHYLPEPPKLPVPR